MDDFLIGLLNEVCGSGLFNSIFDTLSINLFSADGQFAGALDVVRGLHYDVIKPLALMLMFVYFMLAVVDKLTQENFTWEQLWRQMALLLVSKYLIDHGFEILELLFDIGMAVAAEIQEWTGYGGSDSTAVSNAQEILERFRSSLGMPNWLSDICLILFMIFPYLASWVMKIAVSVICYTRVMEIYIRATFAPVALADFFHSGLQGSGWRYLKNFLAVCLQGGFILVVAVIYSALMQQLTVTETDLFKFTGVFIAFGASACMILFKSLSLTKELVGTN